MRRGRGHRRILASQMSVSGSRPGWWIRSSMARLSMSSGGMRRAPARSSCAGASHLKHMLQSPAAVAPFPLSSIFLYSPLFTVCLNLDLFCRFMQFISSFFAGCLARWH
ncbi:hypothetical protein VPH35_057023 [Triticum aestivum]